MVASLTRTILKIILFTCEHRRRQDYCLSKITLLGLTESDFSDHFLACVRVLKLQDFSSQDWTCWGLNFTYLKRIIIGCLFRTVQGMDKASSRLSNVQELLKNAIFLQQQIKYEQSRRLLFHLNVFCLGSVHNQKWTTIFYLKYLLSIDDVN